jgi:CheY-like chemotaxis protein
MDVLLVDDDPALARDLRLLLPPGFNLTPATDCRSALEKFVQGPLPDAAILDLGFGPDSTRTGSLQGLVLLRVLREILKVRTPVVVMSGLADPGAEGLSMRFGAQAYLDKPCSVERLARVLTSIT